MSWYHKTAEQLLLGTAVLNAYSNTSFKEQIVFDLLGLDDEPVETVKQTGHQYFSESNTFVGLVKNKRRIRTVSAHSEF